MLQVHHLKKTFHSRHGFSTQALRAVDDVSFSVGSAETVALVGESGSGKSTVGRCLVRLTEPDSGDILFQGRPIGALAEKAFRPYRKSLQMIFQDPYGSLNPRKTVEATLREILHVHGLADESRISERIRELLDETGLPASILTKYPHECSGGQRQRISIMRALAVSPKLIVCDEIVSALDVSVRAQIINLMSELQARLGLAYLFIAHDLAVVHHLAHRVLVMYRGRIVESGVTEELLVRPQHPYTRMLLASIPDPNPEVRREGIAAGMSESSGSDHWTGGCAFQNRCPMVQSRCRRETPDLVTREGGRDVRCFYV